ncbi:glycosyltransferase family 4 protein [Hypoxylon sp. CI-4A]|nr:glycosyltransferase family 4 protein [Hypoxylon sp. CI-4A]
MARNCRGQDVFPPGLRGKRILLCTESLGPVNGVSRTTKMLLDHLRSGGALVSVVAPYNHTKVNTFNPRTLNDSDSWCADSHPPYADEVRLTGYPLPFNPELSVAYPVQLSELYRRTFGGPPDLIYLASPASLGFQVMLQLRQYAKESQVPIICNFQTDLAGYCSLLFPWPLGGIANYVFGLVQGYLFRDSSVKTIFYPSNFVRKYLAQVKVPSEKMKVLQRGVDTDGFSMSKRSAELRTEWAPNGRIILFTCSRLAGEKGFAFLAQAVIELDRRGMDFMLVVVGGNRNPVVEQEVKEMFAPLQEKDKVVFAGFKVGEELMTYYASADIFLHCSITETFGLVVLEAMATGLPVIARDEGGPSDIIENGTTGYLVPPNDLDGFVEKILKLGNDPCLYSLLSHKAREFACEATWEKIGNRAAWQMFYTIEQREIDREASTKQKHLPIVSGLLSSASVRRFVIPQVIKVKSAFALSIIFVFWAVVGSYLIFANVGHRIKTYIPRIHALVKPTNQG